MFVPYDMILRPTSSEAAPIWVANPQTRSTFDLVSSCILTLILCVWTAVHLNVPGFQERKEYKWWKPVQKKILWMCVGLIAPEVMPCNSISKQDQFVRACPKLPQRWSSRGK